MGSGTNPEQPATQHLGSGGPLAPLASRVPPHVRRSNEERWRREKELQHDIRQYIKRHGMPVGVNVDHEQGGNNWMDCNGGWGPRWYQELQRIDKPRLKALKGRFLKSTPPSEREWLDMYNYVHPHLHVPSAAEVSEQWEQQAMDEARKILQHIKEHEVMSVADKQMQCSRKALLAALQKGFAPAEALVIADKASKLPIEEIEKESPGTGAQLRKEEIEKLLSCGVCFQPLQDPVMLCVLNTETNTPCMHRFCEGCIDERFKRGKRRCVLCKANVEKIEDVVKDRFTTQCCSGGASINQLPCPHVTHVCCRRPHTHINEG